MQKSAIWIVSSVFTFLQICQCVWSKYNIHCCEKLQLAGGRLSSLLPLKTFGFCDLDGYRWAWLSSDLQAFLPFSAAWLMPPLVSVWAKRGRVQPKVSGSVCGTPPYARFMTHSRKKKNLPVTYLQVYTTATRLLAYVWHLCHMHEFVSFCSRTAGSSHSL